MVISARVKDNQRGSGVGRKTTTHILQMTFLSLLLASHSPFRQKHRIHSIVFAEVPQCPCSSSSPAPHLLGGPEHGRAQREDAPALTPAESQPHAVTTGSYWFLRSKLAAGSGLCRAALGANRKLRKTR